ncbi:MAG TPA: hypothetical protein VGK88_06975 [bacterium]
MAQAIPLVAGTLSSVIRLFIALLALAAVFSTPAAAQTIVATIAGEDATEANSQSKLARDAGGTIYLVYAGPSGGFSQIYLARSSDGGRRWRIIPVTAGRVHARFPSLVIDRGGTVHVAWTQYDGGTGRVYYARYREDRWTPPVRVSTGLQYAGIPSIAVDAAGTVHLVWYGIRAQAPVIRTRHGSIYEILYTHSQGARWLAPVVISPGIPDAINPTLAADESGRLHSAWYQFDSRVYQARYTQRDAAWARPVDVSTGGSDAASVAMAVESGGTIHLVWEQRSDSGTRIFYAEKTSRWSGQQLISAPGQRACCPSVAVDAQRRVYVVWESDGQLYLSRRDGNWAGIDRLTSQAGNHNPVLGGSGDHVDLAWVQQSGQNRQVRFATIAGGPSGMATPSPSPRGIIILIVIALLIIWQVRRMRAAQRRTS